jgi:hypothetical protein
MSTFFTSRSTASSLKELFELAVASSLKVFKCSLQHFSSAVAAPASCAEEYQGVLRGLA